MDWLADTAGASLAMVFLTIPIKFSKVLKLAK
jgi:hypothetical protein